MRFYLYLLLGFLGGVPAGMGMGGGTVTIPLLLLFGGVEQKVAQAANLFAFLPTGACALRIHAKNGLIDKKSALLTSVSSLAFGAIGSLFALALPSQILRKTFGLFLIVLALFSLSDRRSAKNAKS